MEWKNEEIMKSFNGVIRDSKNMNSVELEKKYSEFKESFSKLYDVAVDAAANNTVQDAHNLLTMMMKARDKMNNGKMTKMTTDMYVGNELGKKYIYPLTNTPSQEDYRQAISKIKEKIEKGDGNGDGEKTE
jgi:hypothetical protein